jgi:periplasmic protein TonB
MATGGFYEPKKVSPTGLTLVIALHAAAITALALSKMDVPGMKVFTPIEVTDYKEPPIPEPIPEPKDQPKTQPKSRIDNVVPIIDPPIRQSDPVVLQPKVEPIIFDPGPSGKDLKPADPLPKIVPPPVRIEAQMLRSSELQPPYPASEQRSETEGRVAIRVRIGANGRVIAVEKVSATNDAFYRATERHALRSWRFKPAMLDGKPVESSKVITVTFRLDE